MNGSLVLVRRATVEDAAAMCAVSLAAIQHSAAAHYSPDQLTAWSGRRSVEGHRRMVEETTAFVAVVGGELAGFATVAPASVGALQAGEVDQLFVAPAYGGRGVARGLLAAVEELAREAGLKELVTHASWRAAPVFERSGYRRVEEEAVDLDGVRITRVRMRRSLDEGS
jgi:putative acetyltransferase